MEGRRHALYSTDNRLGLENEICPNQEVPPTRQTPNRTNSVHRYERACSTERNHREESHMALRPHPVPASRIVKPPGPNLAILIRDAAWSSPTRQPRSEQGFFHSDKHDGSLGALAGNFREAV